ncbi:MAG: radical SAM protein [Thermodesulfobacteriota bacterium]
MGRCQCCNQTAVTISNAIGFCADCLRDRFDQVWPEVKKVHDRTRRVNNLPLDPPRSEPGRLCPLCSRECRLAEGETGYCGLRRIEAGTIKGGRPHEGNLSCYFDPLPTNCVADFVCPAGANGGYPAYSYSPGPEYGYKNLAVFYQACSFNCLFCQNHHYRDLTRSKRRLPARDLARIVDDRTACICYFGGDPTPQVLHALKAAALARRRFPGRVLRICWETNGSAQEPWLGLMGRISLDSGGCVKFDLKAWDDRIHQALCGVSNRQTLANFRKMAAHIPLRPDPPFLIASTLMVPGYVDEEEVAAIASFLAELNPSIPYSLLAFHPTFYLKDLPPTSWKHARRCREAALKAGLDRIHLGNQHLLDDYY